jgi:hypothetical protein
VVTALAETAERYSCQPPIDVGATLAMEVGFATGDQVDSKFNRGTPCLLGSTGIPCISIHLIAMGLVGWWGGGRLWLSERDAYRWQRHRVQPLLNDERWQWVGCAGYRDLSWW